MDYLIVADAEGSEEIQDFWLGVPLEQAHALDDLLDEVDVGHFVVFVVVHGDGLDDVEVFDAGDVVEGVDEGLVVLEAFLEKIGNEIPTSYQILEHHNILEQIPLVLLIVLAQIL